MNAKKLRRMVGGFVCLLAGTLNAEDLVWTGSVDSTWDTQR
jgi:hypothetical protein